MTSSIQQKAADLVLLRREIRRSFEEWCVYVLSKNEQTPARHHLKIIEVLQGITDGQLKRVILLMPPGSAKSTFASVLYPIWHLNVNPRDLILACSYSYSLIEGFGRQCRDKIEEYQHVLGYSLSKSAAAAGDWRIDKGGGYFCAGVGAGIAGHRADIGIIDDFMGSEEEADSELIREKIIKWYDNDFLPRLKPDAAQILICNRRHEEDLIGHLMKNEPDDWLVLKFPMIAEEGDILGRAKSDLLWPEWFGMNPEALKKVEKARKKPRTWAGLYQQRPEAEEGNYFDANSIVEYTPNMLPKDLRIYAGSDWTVRKTDLSDFTCHLIAGLCPQGRLWIIDWFWEQCDTVRATDEMFRLYRQYRPVVWWHGRENITGAIGPFINLKMKETQTYIPITELSEAKDKETKAAPIKARMISKMVMFPGWLNEWDVAKQQLKTFPAAANDDFVDALAKFGQGLDMMVRASERQPMWDGVIETQRLTCDWIVKSSDRRQRRERRRCYSN